MRQRTLAGTAVAATGLVLAAAELWQGLLVTDRPLVLLFGTGPFVLLALSLTYVGYWLARMDEYDPDQTRILAWGLGGASLFLSVAVLILFNQRADGGAFLIPLQISADMLTIGTVVGVLVGLYDARSRRRRRDLDAERARIEAFGKAAADCNTYGRAISQSSELSEVSALCIQAIGALLGLDRAAVLADGDDGYTIVEATFDSEAVEALADVATRLEDDEPTDVRVCDESLPEGLAGPGDSLVGALVTDAAGPAVVLVAVGDGDGFDDAELQLLELLVAHAATAIEGIYAGSAPQRASQG